jgi:hypothetical protein
MKTYTHCIRRLTRTVYEDLHALYIKTYTRCILRLIRPVYEDLHICGIFALLAKF